METQTLQAGRCLNMLKRANVHFCTVTTAEDFETAIKQLNDCRKYLRENFDSDRKYMDYLARNF